MKERETGSFRWKTCLFVRSVMFERVEILSLYSGQSLLSWLWLITMLKSGTKMSCLIQKLSQKLSFDQKKWCFLTLRWPQKAFLKRPQVACYDVKMTCKKCYRKLNPKIGLCHMTQIMWSKITCFLRVQFSFLLNKMIT